MSAKQQAKKSTVTDHFTDSDVTEVLDLLKAVNEITEIGWEFKEHGLVVTGLDEGVSEVTLSHPRSARAYLDAYLLGYNHGRSDR